MSKQLGILLYDNVQPMDVIGPWEVFSFWQGLMPEPITLQLISENGSLVQGDHGITLTAHCDFEQAPLLDYLIVPGGRGRREQIHNEKLIGFIRKQAAHCEYLLSICTGMFLIYQAGLLSGKSATTYWRALPEAKKLSGIHVVEERIVKNKNIWLSGGVTSGIDLALEFIAEVAGKDMAGKVQLLLEYFPEKTMYSTPNAASALPPYGNREEQIDLPAYIKKSFEEGKNQ